MRNRLFSVLGCLLFPMLAQATSSPTLELHPFPGFFRFSMDRNVNMPNDIPRMGLMGFNFFGDITPWAYAGFGGYGSVTGTQGGLFTVGVEGGLHREIVPHWWGDIGLFVGGGGGKASLTGGGLMLRPHAGVALDIPWGRLGLFYSYVDFPNGEIHSQQFGVSFDVPFELSYLTPYDTHAGLHILSLENILPPSGQYTNFQRNDFALFVQAYFQRAGTLNTLGNVQDQTMGLVGAKLDHYISRDFFWWFKTSGAFSGIPNGYMDVLGGLGYRLPLGTTNFALLPQFGLGAGGGGLVETGGGFLVNPIVSLEWALSPRFATRVSSGYIWSPQGQFNVVPITAELVFHLDVADADHAQYTWSGQSFTIQGWRFQVFNQTYFHPQRSFNDVTSPIELVGIQIDQLFTPWFFLSYQAAGAYSGYHAGGYATGMIGGGLQTPAFFAKHLQLFSQILVGAGGGGGLALSGGSLIEPLIGARFNFTPLIGVQASVGELKALSDHLSTPVLNVGLTMRFDTLNRDQRQEDIG